MLALTVRSKCKCRNVNDDSNHDTSNTNTTTNTTNNNHNNHNNTIIMLLGSTFRVTESGGQDEMHTVNITCSLSYSCYPYTNECLGVTIVFIAYIS